MVRNLSSYLGLLVDGGFEVLRLISVDEFDMDAELLEEDYGKYERRIRGQLPWAYL